MSLSDFTCKNAKPKDKRLLIARFQPLHKTQGGEDRGHHGRRALPSA